MLRRAMLAVLLHGVAAGGGMCDDAASCNSIHALFGAAMAGKIERAVEKTPAGYIAVTTSADASTVARLHSHVEAMRRRVHDGRSINTRDPLFAAIFREGAVTLRVTNRTDGVRVEEVATSECAIALAHAHADVVSGFASRGMAEAMRSHAVPGECPFSSKAPHQGDGGMMGAGTMGGGASGGMMDGMSMWEHAGMAWTFARGMAPSGLGGVAAAAALTGVALALVTRAWRGPAGALVAV